MGKQSAKSSSQPKKKTGASKEPSAKPKRGSKEKLSKEKLSKEPTGKAAKSAPWKPTKEPLVKKPLPSIPVMKAPSLPVIPITKPSSGKTTGTGPSATKSEPGKRASAPSAPGGIPFPTNVQAILEHVSMIPSKSVTFYPNDQRQQTYLVIQNESNVRIMFKMKSTRPTLYKMKPVFGIVHPGEKFSVRLIYKGIKVGNRIPLNDRFTVVVATNVDQPTEAGWEKASKAEPAAMRKRTLEILYTGVNDKVRKVSAEGLEKRTAVPSKESIKVESVEVEAKRPKPVTKESLKVESVEVEAKRPKPVTKESLKVESQFAIKVGSKEDAKQKVTSKVSKKVPKKVEVPSKEEVKVVSDSAKPEYWMEVQDHERVWMKKLLDREDRWMQTAEEEPQARSMLTAMIPGLDEMKAKSLIKQEQRTYLDGYYEGYKAGLVERQGAKEGAAVESALSRPSLKEDNAKNRAYKIGFIEGYNRAKLLRRTWKEKSVMKALEPLTAKENRQAVPVAVSDGRNVTAKTPGGGSPILVDPLQKRDIVHITRTGKKAFLIVMYRDPKVPENLISRSGDDEDDSPTTSNQDAKK